MHGDRSVPWICAALALLPALVFIATTTSDGVFTVDCGGKLLQANRLLDTGYRDFDLPYHGRRYDPAGNHFPVPPPYAAASGDRFFSQYPVAYPALAAPFARAFGPAGLRLPAALGLAACAGLLAAWVLPVFGRAWALAAGLGLALASPLSFYGVTIWEHAPSVALALAAQLLATRPNRARLIGAGATVGLACCLREELFLVGMALAAALLVTRRRPADLFFLAVGAAPLAAALFAFNTQTLGHPLGGHVIGNVGAAHSPSAIQALRDLGAILAGYGSGSAEAWLLGLLVAVCILGGQLAVRRALPLAAPLAAISTLALAAWLAAWLRLADASHPVLVLAHTNGFLLRMPLFALAGAGLALVAQRGELSPLRFGVWVGGFFLLFGLAFRVLLTDFHAGFHWAPRMLLPALPAFAVLGMAVLREAISASSLPTRRIGAAALAGFAIAGIASSAQALWLLERMKRDSRDLERYVLALDDEVVVTDHVAISQQLPGVWGEKVWLLVSGPTGSTPLWASLQREGVERFAVLARPARAKSALSLPGYRCAWVERRRSKRIPAVLDVDVHACRAVAKSG